MGAYINTGKVMDLVDANRVKSVVETTYDIKEYIEGLIFTKRKRQLEMRLYAKKTFEGGKLSKHEWLDYKERESSEKEDDVVRRNICEYRNGVEVTHRGYNANGKLIYEERLDYSNGWLMRYIERRHKSDGNTEMRFIFHKWKFTEEGGSEEVVEDENGCFIAKHIYYPNGRLKYEQTSGGEIWCNKYNERGEAVLVYASGYVKYSGSRRVEYRYDDKGNWIEMEWIKDYSNGSVHELLVTRDIEYLY